MAHEIGRESFHKNFQVRDIEAIRAAYIEGTTQKSLSEEFGCSIKLIYNIVHLKAYADVPASAEYKLALQDRK